MKKAKKNSKLRKLVVTLICSVALFITTTAAIALKTLYEESFLVNQIEKTKYSELVVKETNNSFKEENIEKSEFSNVIASSISPTFIDQALKAFIHYTYHESNEDELSSMDELEKEITQAIEGYAKKHQLTIEKEEENEIKTMKSDFMFQLQANIGSQYLLIFIENTLSTVDGMHILFYIGVAVFLLSCVYLFILIKKNGYLILRYGAFILGISGGMSLLLVGLLYARDFLEQIAFRSQATLQLMKNYVQEILGYFLLAGVAMIISAAFIGLMSEIIRRKSKKNTHQDLFEKQQ